ncbi:glycosyltransferase [Natronomonas salsuginis]|uniref:Glycosyltransferase family 4 protein n=1 Tax=Natronomonas salsuginis TaxID=2217661 RepID=A0A4U5J858_9EURY|nr:glycosyltransferase family 4 protein [Natronomonas salsuginis]TKR25242.1 glycosyltransferase family 4 protein [Natronomonas salsuginis]
MSTGRESIRVLWLRPTVGTHISTRRERIKEGLTDRGVTVDIVDTSGTEAIGAIKQAFSEEYDLIAGTVRVGVYYGYLLARVKGVPFVAEVTEPIERVREDLPWPVFRFFKWYEWNVLERADARFFVEEDVLERVRRRGMDGHLARNSVWYEKFADPDPTVVTSARDHLEAIGVDFDSPVAIYLGGFTRQQHIPEILDAIPKCPEWDFLFLGEDGQHAGAVEEAAETHENAYFGGVVPHDEVPGYLSVGDVGFSLSLGERPLKLLEYGAAGLTVLGIPGRRQRIFSDDQVHFIEPTPDRIAETLEKIRLDPEAVPATGSALQTYAKHNSWDDIAQLYYDVFCESID